MHAVVERPVCRRIQFPLARLTAVPGGVESSAAAVLPRIVSAVRAILPAQPPRGPKYRRWLLST